jgi:RimJ/RimL family protein N-acetyltransferase
MDYLLDGQASTRLMFRKLKRDDFPVWLNFFSDPLLHQYWLTEDNDPEKQCAKWFDKNFYRYATKKGGMNVLIHKQSGAFVGQCGLLFQTVNDREELEVAYSIMPQYRNQGFATEAATKCIQHAFNNHMTKSLISIIHESNVESEKVAIKSGMQIEKRTLYGNNPVKIYRINASSSTKQ